MSHPVCFVLVSSLLLQTDTIFLSALNFADEPASTTSGMRNNDDGNERKDEDDDDEEDEDKEEEDNDNNDDKCKDKDKIERGKVSLPFLFVCLLNISADLTSNFSACLCRGRERGRQGEHNEERTAATMKSARRRTRTMRRG